MQSEDDMLKMLENGGVNDMPNMAEQGMSAQAYNNIQNQESNLIVWQLELDNILERVEHLLRGHIIKEDKDGNMSFVEPKDKRLIVLNSMPIVS